jgi:hypothetical protein
MNGTSLMHTLDRPHAMASKLPASLKAAINRFGSPAPAPSRGQLATLFKSYDEQIKSRNASLSQRHWITLAVRSLI